MGVNVQTKLFAPSRLPTIWALNDLFAVFLRSLWMQSTKIESASGSRGRIGQRDHGM